MSTDVWCLFQAGRSVSTVVSYFSQVDLYPLMCELLGVMPAPNNGTLEVAGLMLQQTPIPQLNNVRSAAPCMSYKALLAVLLTGLASLFTCNR